jgi:hypothetical protein
MLADEPPNTPSSRYRYESLTGESRYDNDAGQVDRIAVLSIGALVIGVPHSQLCTVLPFEGVLFCNSAPPWVFGLTPTPEGWYLVVSMEALLNRTGVGFGRKVRVAAVRAPDGRKLGLLVDTFIGFRDIACLDVPPLSAGNDVIMTTTEDQVHLVNLPNLFAHPAVSGEAVRRYWTEEP